MDLGAPRPLLYPVAARSILRKRVWGIAASEKRIEDFLGLAPGLVTNGSPQHLLLGWQAISTRPACK